MKQEDYKASIENIKLQREMVKHPSTDPWTILLKESNMYADDFLIGVIGNKEDAKKIKADLTNFLREVLKLELSQEKHSLLMLPKEHIS